MKIFNTLDEILEFTGCDVAIPTNHPLGKYSVFEVVEPYNCKYLDWATERGILLLDKFSEKTLIAYLPKYNEIGEKEKMEQYIASYKHLIGCEVFGLHKGKYIISMSDPQCCEEYNISLSVYDNAGCLTRFRSISEFKFYLDDETLGTYKEYMQLHYPEYEHVWKHQL